MKNKIEALGLIVVVAFFSASDLDGQPEFPVKPKPEEGKKLDVARSYDATGWMGDGEEGTKYVQFTEACKEQPRSKPTCIKITYTIGPKGWAGIYWLNKPNNWGDKPGEDWSARGYSSITFWARGEKEGEVVEFKAGGVEDNKKPHKDSFEVSTHKVTLEKDWKRYEIKLDGENLSSVIGVFCWVASGSSNPEGLTFYLDDIQYE